MKKADIYQYFHLLLAPHPSEIAGWMKDTDQFLCENGCKLDAKLGNAGESILITYTHRKSDKRICRIYIGQEGCKVFPYGHHFARDNNILSLLPENMLDAMSDNGRECTGCATKRPDLITHSFRFTHKGKVYNRCRHEGFGFAPNTPDERALLTQWLELEIACVL